MVEILLKWGANISVISDEGYTILHTAVRHETVVKLLLGNKSILNNVGESFATQCGVFRAS